MTVKIAAYNLFKRIPSLRAVSKRIAGSEVTYDPSEMSGKAQIVVRRGGSEVADYPAEKLKRILKQTDPKMPISGGVTLSFPADPGKVRHCLRLMIRTRLPLEEASDAAGVGLAYGAAKFASQMPAGRKTVKQGDETADLGAAGLLETIAECSAELEIYPDSVESLLNRGRAQARLGRLEKAIADYDAALGYGADKVKVLLERGDAKAELGRYGEAIADYNAVLEQSPGNYLALNNRGNAYAYLGRYEKAIADYDAALVLDPDNARILFNRGQAKRRCGQRRSAEADMTRAKQLRGILPDLLKKMRAAGWKEDQ